MARDSDPLAGVFETSESGGILAGLLAEEGEFDRAMMWRLGSWGGAAVGAVVIAVLANQAQLGWRRDQVAATDLARQAERLQMVNRENQSEARRLASAIETLSADRDRLYSRVTVLEQGLDSVTGAIARQSSAPSQPTNATAPEASPSAVQAQAPAPVVAPVASIAPASADKARVEMAKDVSKEPAKDTSKPVVKEQAALPPQPPAAATQAVQSAAPAPAVAMVATKSILAPPDPAAPKLIAPEKTESSEKGDKPALRAEQSDKSKADAASPPEIVTASAEAESGEGQSASPAIPVQQTRFAVDLGSASSIGGLRGLWQGLIKTNPELAGLRPIIMIKESKGASGMQLRLGAGPLINAAAAAKICAGLVENERACETTVFDGQRLSLRAQEAAPQAQEDGALPAKQADKPQHRRSYSSKRAKRDEPAAAPAASPAPSSKPETTASSLSNIFGRGKTQN